VSSYLIKLVLRVVAYIGSEVSSEILDIYYIRKLIIISIVTTIIRKVVGLFK